MSRSSQLGWSGLWCSRQCNNICAAECWCVLTEASPEKESERRGGGVFFTCPGHTAPPPLPPCLTLCLPHPSPLITHLHRVLTHRADGWRVTMIHFSPRYATCTKLESWAKEAFETSRVLSYHWSRERDDLSRVRGEGGGNRCGPPWG